MTKRLVDIDDELLAAAHAVAGERTIKATVKRSLEELVAGRRQDERDLTARWNDLGDVLGDLQDSDVMRRAWS